MLGMAVTGRIAGRGIGKQEEEKMWANLFTLIEDRSPVEFVVNHVWFLARWWS